MLTPEEIESLREKEIHDQLLKEVKKIQKIFKYTNQGEAFVHVFVRAHFDFSDEDAADAAQVGVSGHDKGIDAFYVGETDGIVYVIGGTLESRSFGPEILVDIERAMKFLSSPLAAGLKQDLQTIWSDYCDCMRKGFSTRYILAILGTINEEARTKLDELRREGRKQNWEIDVFERKEVLTWTSFPFFGKGPDVKFTIETQPLLFAPAGFRSIMLPVRGSELAEIVRKHRYSVFALNLREYLGRNPVNRQIEDSLGDPKRRKLFWYLNLGVDAICGRFEVARSPQETLSGKERQQVLKVNNFRIINGLQTSVMLREHEKEVEECYLMLRLIETTDRDLAFDIAVAKNRQTPIRGRDLFAPDTSQVILARKAENLAKPFFYERRTKDWETHRERSQIRRKFGNRVIRNHEVARAYLATVLQKPFEAEHQGRFIFYEYGGLYQEVFKEDTKIEDLIAADEIDRTVRRNQGQMRKEFKDLTQRSWKEKLRDEDQSKLQNLSYLVHARWYLIALMWYFIDKFIPKQDTKRLFTFDRPISGRKRERLDKLQDIAERIIVQYMRGKESEAKELGTRFPGARNVFARKGTYKDLRGTADLWVEPDVVIGIVKK